MSLNGFEVGSTCERLFFPVYRHRRCLRRAGMRFEPNMTLRAPLADLKLALDDVDHLARGSTVAHHYVLWHNRKEMFEQGLSYASKRCVQRLAVVIVDPACDCCSVLDPRSRGLASRAS
jgi:hypothetical protein